MLIVSRIYNSLVQFSLELFCGFFQAPSSIRMTNNRSNKLFTRVTGGLVYRPTDFLEFPAIFSTSLCLLLFFNLINGYV